MQVLFSGDTLTITDDDGDYVIVTMRGDYAEVRNPDGVLLGGIYQDS